VNRGLAILGNTLFMATIDARLVAVDARDGKPLWRTAVAEPTDGYAMTMAPLVVKDKVIVGVAGGEYGIRGFIAAFDAVRRRDGKGSVALLYHDGSRRTRPRDMERR